MRALITLVCLLGFIGVAVAQPPRMEWKGKVKELGDPERLEKPAGPREGDRQRMQRERGPHAMPGEFRQHAPGWGPGKNKYGGPKNGMQGWGGDPFKPFGPGRPWGQMQEPPRQERHRQGGPQHKLVCPHCGKVIV